MIDEELYQQATDELNSDRRRPHLWARACALASDDHDEARYLYTNLRVEELIADRERAPQAAVSTNDDPEGGEYELAPVSVEGTRETTEPPAGVASVRTGTDDESTEAFDDFGLLELEPVEQGEVRPSSVRTESRLDTDALDDVELDSDEIVAMNDQDRTPGDEEIALARGHEPPSREPDVIEPADDALWLDDDRLELPAADDTTDEFDESVDQTSELDDYDVAQATEPPIPAPAAAMTDVPHDARLTDETGPESGRRSAPHRTFPRDDYADSRDLDDLLEDEADPLPLIELDGNGPVWAVYETSEGQLETLRRGVSWAAMLLTLPWLLTRGLFGTAVLYAILWCVALGGALVTGVAWMDASTGASSSGASGGFSLLLLLFIGFVTIAVIGLIILPFVSANRWRESAWRRRGHTLRGELRARSADAAMARVTSAGARSTARR